MSIPDFIYAHKDTGILSPEQMDRLILLNEKSPNTQQDEADVCLEILKCLDLLLPEYLY